MSRVNSKRKQSERNKFILAVVLAIVLLFIVARQFGENQPNLTEDSPANSTPNVISTSVASKPNSQLSIREVDKKTPDSKDQKAAVVPAFDLPRRTHDEIATHNPFYELDVTQEDSAEELLPEQSEALVTSDKLKSKSKIHAIYLTTEGATALVDGELIPVENPRPAIDSIKANWGNDFSPTGKATEN